MENSKKTIHFIGIGGSLMHNVAIALHKLGFAISGSDEDVKEPSLAKLLKNNLLPQRPGFDANRIHAGLDYVIFGRLTQKDNPELLKAQQIGLKVFTCPEFIHEFAMHKQRVVVVGSHGRDVVAHMMMHVLRSIDRKTDCLIARAGHSDYDVVLTDAPVIIIDGSESPSTPLYHTPQFIKYKHHIGVLTDITWNEETSSLNENDFIRQYDLFADATPKGGMLIYHESDKIAVVICDKERPDVLYIPYKGHPVVNDSGRDYLIGAGKEKVAINFSGHQHLGYCSAAFEGLKRIGVTNDQFYHAMASYKAPE
jgi:UDP-N-acetylmuramate: L-alanyl-gamma-D-glutamyl-meso-diaminopimelate ligase